MRLYEFVNVITDYFFRLQNCLWYYKVQDELKFFRNLQKKKTISIINQLSSSIICHKLAAYELVSDYFGFFSHLKYVFSNEEIQSAAKKLVAEYRDDLEDIFNAEIIHFPE